MRQPPPLPRDRDLQDDSYVFVSYARKDKLSVYPEVERIEADGYRLWCDKRDIVPGSAWHDSLLESVDRCLCMILFMSEAAAASGHVREEVERAFQNQKIVLCIYIEKVKIPWFAEKFELTQSIPRYSLQNDEYQALIRKALFKHVGPPRARFILDHERPSQSFIIAGVPSQFAFILLALPAVFCVLLGAFGLVDGGTLIESMPGDPLLNQAVVVTLKFLCGIGAIGFGTGAFLIHRKYSRRT